MSTAEEIAELFWRGTCKPKTRFFAYHAFHQNQGDKWVSGEHILDFARKVVNSLACSSCSECEKSKARMDIVERIIERQRYAETCPLCMAHVKCASNGHERHLKKCKALERAHFSQAKSITINGNVTININSNNACVDSAECTVRTTCGGWIYALTCPMYQTNGYIKLGQTRGCNDESGTRKSLANRYGTALIDPKILAVMHTDDCCEAEKILFQELAQYRLSPNREIFVFDKLQDAVGNILLPAMWRAAQAGSSSKHHAKNSSIIY